MNKKFLMLLLSLFLIIGSINIFGAITDGITNHYAFDVNNQTFQIDSSPVKNNLTYSAGTQTYVTTCKVGGCFNFTSSATHFQSQLAMTETGTSVRTSKWWAKSPWTNLDTQFMDYGTLNTAQQWNPASWSGSGKVRIAWYGSACEIATPTSNTWEMWSASYDGSKILAYKNGVNVANCSIALNTGSSVLRIAADQNVLVDEITYWNRSLNSTEHLQVYTTENAGTSLYAPGVTNFTITNTNNYNNASILNFSALIIPNTGFCYQESINVSNQNNLDNCNDMYYNGTYVFSGNWTPSTNNLIDGNYSTSQKPLSNTYANMTINYVPPSTFQNNSLWKVSYTNLTNGASGTSNVNISLNNCYNFAKINNNLSLFIEIFENDTASGDMIKFYCYNGINNILLHNDTRIGGVNRQNKLYDEAVIWKVNESTYTTTTNTITTPYLSNSTSLYNITITSDGYFNQSYTNYNISSNLIASQYQSIINFSGMQIITNDTFYNYTIKLNGTLVCNITGIDTSCLAYPNAGVYTATLTPNDGVTFHASNTTINISALQNGSVYLYAHDHEINVTARNIRNNASINVFNITVSSFNRTDVRTYNTTTGSIIVPAIHDTYSLTIDATNYSLFNNTKNVSITSGDLNTTFYLYTDNSFKINFYDSTTLVLLNNRTVSLNLISEVYSNNYSTSNGSIYIDILTPETYTLRFESLPDYPERFYVTTLVDRSTEFLNLYLINTSLADVQTITLTLVDNFNNPYLDSFVEVLRYDITTNSYLLQEVLTVDVEGKAYFTGELNTEYYKFIVEKPFGTVTYISEPQYLRSTTLTLRISTTTLYADNFYKAMNMYSDLTFNDATNNFRYEYNDALNNIVGAKLEVYTIASNGAKTLINTTTVNGASGTILINVANTTGSRYIAKAYVNVNDVYYFMEDLEHKFKQELDATTKGYRMWLIMILTIALIMLTISVDKTLSLIIAPIPLLVATMTEFVSFRKDFAIGMLLIALTIAYLTNKKS